MKRPSEGLLLSFFNISIDKATWCIYWCLTRIVSKLLIDKWSPTKTFLLCVFHKLSKFKVRRFFFSFVKTEGQTSLGWRLKASLSYRNVSTETPSRVFNKFFRIVFYHVTFFLLINQEFSCENYIDKEIESSDVRLLHVNKYCTELYRTVGAREPMSQCLWHRYF